MCLDHVVPISVCTASNIIAFWSDDAINKVLACAACNTFGNRYRPDLDICLTDNDVASFCDLRDEIFLIRQEKILEKRKLEEAIYETRPWIPTTKLE